MPEEVVTCVYGALQTHVLLAEFQVHGELHWQVPTAPVTLQAKLVMLVSQLIGGTAPELHVAPL